MKKIAVITSTRADFGLLMPVIKELRKYENDNFITELVVTGTHLVKSYGYTVDDIIKNGIRIDEMIRVSVLNKNANDISANQAEILRQFTLLFSNKKYYGIVILGDRYEMLAIAIAAGNNHTPIFHLCGGDTTEGAIDEWIRHCITKISYLHFTTNDISYKRVLQLGESPDRVFNYGSTSVDNIVNISKMEKADVLRSIGLLDCKFALCTYHPVTMEENNVEKLINNLLSAIKAFPEIEFIVTKSNADLGGTEINKLLDNANSSIINLHVYSSLGLVRYLSLMKHAAFVIGNSSSGIVETPLFKIPTINIGNRQRGRLQSESTINCKEDEVSIKSAINKALSREFRDICLNVVSPYGDGHAAERIAKKIYQVIENDSIDLKKKFYDFS